MSEENKTEAPQPEAVKASEEPEAAETPQVEAASDAPAAEGEESSTELPDAPPAPEEEDEESGYQAKAKPELDDATRAALDLRAQKQKQNPRFRRHEWFRYKKLGGKHAPWRRPTGIHSKQRRHFKYRPPLVSIGYRTPAAARGLHPSGFEEVLVHRPADLEGLDPKIHAARVGGTVGGRKAELIEKRADQLGVRVLNRRGN
jgi:large subunit ribosomal protein L32e